MSERASRIEFFVLWIYPHSMASSHLRHVQCGGSKANSLSCNIRRESTYTTSSWAVTESLQEFWFEETKRHLHFCCEERSLGVWEFGSAEFRDVTIFLRERILCDFREKGRSSWATWLSALVGRLSCWGRLTGPRRNGTTSLPLSSRGWASSQVNIPYIRCVVRDPLMRPARLRMESDGSWVQKRVCTYWPDSCSSVMFSQMLTTFSAFLPSRSCWVASTTSTRTLPSPAHCHPTCLPQSTVWHCVGRCVDSSSLDGWGTRSGERECMAGLCY